ncbi:hypothetical protein SAMN05444161_2755 [Rhizobiales bacterium GAS191]|jgi:hypothetical protein|nr:hypothetical protein SAMN05444161_2755 [Rhizobiales bacterium GAS191]
MSMKRLFNMLAILSLCVGAGLISLPAAQAKSVTPIAAGAMPELGSGLPRIAAGHHLLEAYYRHYYHRHYYHRHYYHRHYYHRHYYHRGYYRHSPYRYR